jgi:Phospholipase_D-nuclease N-terminal
MQPFALPFFLETPRGLEFLGLLFWVWMVYECVKRERNSTEKILWLLFIMIPVVGPLIYFLLRVVKIRG